VNFSVNEKQQILEITDVKSRLEKVHYLLNKELQVLELGTKIQNEVQGELNKTQRHYYLREQLKAIKKELGDGDEVYAQPTHQVVERRPLHRTGRLRVLLGLPVGEDEGDVHVQLTGLLPPPYLHQQVPGRLVPARREPTKLHHDVPPPIDLRRNSLSG